MEQLTVKRVEHAEIGAAKLHRLAEHRVEDWNEIPGGAADHAQHFGCRGLLFERLRQLLCPCLHLVEQPDIFDRDHGLIGEGLQQRDLLFGERIHFGAAKRDRSNTLTFAQQRHAQNGSIAQTAGQLSRFRKVSAFGGEHVVQVYRHPFDDRPPCDPIAANGPFFKCYRYRTVMRAVAQSSPSRRCRTASWASQSAQALSTMALRTGPTSVGEEAITLRILLLPVW